MKRLAFTILATFALTGSALAHEGHASVSGFASGLLHPITGADHLLAMVAVGLIAALCGGRMLWAFPITFVGAMLLGAVVGLADFVVPAVEMWIVASVIVLGLVAAVPSNRLPQGLMLAGIGLFGLFHGYAHGTEAPSAGSIIAYLIGFTIATTALHGVGLLIGRRLPVAFTRIAGAAIAVAGISLPLIG